MLYEVITGSIVTIYRDGSGNGRVNCWAAISAANAPAAIVFEHDYATYPVPDGENVCRLQFWSAGTFNLGQVSGTGMVSVNAPEAIVLNADFGSFRITSYNVCYTKLLRSSGNCCRFKRHSLLHYEVKCITS